MLLERGRRRSRPELRRAGPRWTPKCCPNRAGLERRGFKHRSEVPYVLKWGGWERKRTGPLAEVLDSMPRLCVRWRSVSLNEHALHNLVRLQHLLRGRGCMQNVSHDRSQKSSDGSTHLDDPFLLNVERLEILPRRRRARKNPVLDSPDTLDVVVDSLEALVAARA